MDEQILRTTHLKARSILDYVNIAQERKNPYIRKANEILQKSRYDETNDHERNDKNIDNNNKK